jgi:hypothetical protein
MVDDDVLHEQLTGGGQEPEMIFDPTVRRFVRRVPPEGSHGAVAPAALGVVSMLFVSAVAFFAFLQEPGFTAARGEHSAARTSILRLRWPVSAASRPSS